MQQSRKCERLCTLSALNSLPGLDSDTSNNQFSLGGTSRLSNNTTNITSTLPGRTSLVIGASGIVGSHIVRHLILRGERPPLALSRSPREGDNIQWIEGDLADLTHIDLPQFETLYCTASARLMANALPILFRSSLKRVVLFTTTSISTKTGSKDAEERAGIVEYANAEKKFVEICNSLCVSWTILRPTIIYDEGRDANITRLALFIRRFGFFPLCGRGQGLRQPVHAEDCAIGAIDAASSSLASNKIYEIPGGETISFKEMIGRIFDGLGRRRAAIPLPPFLWIIAFRLAQRHFPGLKASMGARMAKNMVFDPAPATADFGWAPRVFRPRFDVAP
jgi:nucleoside-diphosphate-sugar epimerase